MKRLFSTLSNTPPSCVRCQPGAEPTSFVQLVAIRHNEVQFTKLRDNMEDENEEGTYFPRNGNCSDTKRRYRSRAG